MQTGSGWWHRLRLLIVAPVLIAIALGAWAVSSPVGSSPDEDYHLNSIWCGLGFRAGLCEAGPSSKLRDTPQALSASTCFRFQTNVTATCQDLSKTALAPAARVDSDHSYPPVFYAVMGVFASTHIAASVIIMRLINVLIFVALGAALYALLPPPRRNTLIIAWAVTIVPLSAFLIASINPSGWTITACGTAWLAALSFFETRGARRVGLGILTLVAAVMAAGSRSDGAVYCALGVVIGALIGLSQSGRRISPKAIWPVVIVVVLAGAAFFLSGQSRAIISGLGSGAGAAANDVTQAHHQGLGLLFHNLLDVPWFWTGALGATGLGWLDTQMPTVVWAVGVFAWGGLLLVGLRTLDWRKAAGMAIVFVALVAIPVYTLQISHVQVGVNVQPRYMLPLMVTLAGLAALSVAGRAVEFTLTQRVILIVGISVANSAALYANLARYVHTAANGGFNLSSGVVWWWDGGHAAGGPMLVWAIGTVAFAAAIATAVLWTPALPLPADASAGAPREEEPAPLGA